MMEHSAASAELDRAGELGGETPLDRLDRALRSRLLPLGMLLLALSTVFIFGGERGHFYRGGGHDLVSAEHLTIAVNRSLEQGLAGFHHKTLDEEGDLTYRPYNRFPIGSYLGIKLATLPVSGDLSAQTYVTRVLMLLCFAAAGVLAYFSLCRLTSNRWIALTATLLTFSSYYLLYYNDVIAPDIMPSFFGVMLVFHGMVIFVQEGRFRQLLIKTCIALLLGWTVLALLLAFVIFGLARDVLGARSANTSSTSPSLIMSSKLMASALFRSRFLLLGVVALLFGVSVLTFNFAVEYTLLDSELPLTELPSFNSVTNRTEAIGNPTSDESWQGWPRFLGNQFYRIGGMVVPYYFGTLGKIPLLPFRVQQIVIAAIVMGAILVGSMFVRPRILFATLASFGYLWTLPNSQFVELDIHDFEAVNYVGIPLVFFSLVLLYIHKLSSDRLIVGAAVGAMLVFVGSSFQIARAEYLASNSSFDEAASSEFHDAMLADFEAIRKRTKGKVVFVPDEALLAGGRPGGNALTGVNYGAAYYLSGSTILYADDQDNIDFADFVVTFGYENGDDTLTPENQLVFLYRRVDYDGILSGRSNYNEMKHGERISGPPDPITESDYSRVKYRSRFTVELPEPIPIFAPELPDPMIELAYDVYHVGDYLVYAREAGCQNTHATFFLRVTPRDEKGLLYRDRLYGFENRDFRFDDLGWENEMGCFAVRSLPRYDIARISTGQIGANVVLWSGEFEIGSRQ